eukprot:10508035-Alexandrium_andersonii.AAC.1
MDAYCAHSSLHASQVRFLLGLGQGQPIAPDDTAEGLGLEGQGLIDVVVSRPASAAPPAADAAPAEPAVAAPPA